MTTRSQALAMALVLVGSTGTFVRADCASIRSAMFFAKASKSMSSALSDCQRTSEPNLRRFSLQPKCATPPTRDRRRTLILI